MDPQMQTNTEIVLARLTAGMPGLAVDQMENFRENVQLAIEGGLAARTVRALHDDGRRWAEWCVREGECWLPAAPRVVARFLKEMGALYKPATLDRLAFSIRTWHLLAEVEPPVKSIKVKMVRKAHAREVGRAQAQANGLTLAKIECIIRFLEDPNRDRTLADLRDKALLLTGYNMLARGGELLALKWSDVVEDGRGGHVAIIRRSKTDQEGEGARQHLWPRTVEALMAWKEAHDAELARRRADEPDRLKRLAVGRCPAGTGRGRPRLRAPREPRPLVWIETDFVFRGLAPALVGAKPPPGHADARTYFGWPPRLTVAGLDEILKIRALDGGLVDGGYSSHSMRVGATQDMVAEGYDVTAIMQAGRWKTPTMIARYAANLAAGRSAMAQMGTSSAAPARQKEKAPDAP